MGIENFKEMRTMDYYYVDKTGLIRELLENIAKVNLFTRPRRFGKTLNISMLQYFFEIGSDSSLFEGLEISKEKELCEQYMAKFPVISISLKGISGISFEAAKRKLCSVIAREALRFEFLLQSDKLSTIERQQYQMDFWKIVCLFYQNVCKNIMEKIPLFLLMNMMCRLIKHISRDITMTW